MSFINFNAAIKCLKSLKFMIITQNVFYEKGAMGLSWLGMPASGKFWSGENFFPIQVVRPNRCAIYPMATREQQRPTYRKWGFEGTTTFFFFFFFVSFAFSRAAPAAHGGSQAGGPIEAVAAGLSQSHSNAGSEPRLRPTPQLTATPDP